MKVSFSLKRKSLFKVFYVQNGIITGGFYEPVQFFFIPTGKDGVAVYITLCIRGIGVARVGIDSAFVV